MKKTAIFLIGFILALLAIAGSVPAPNTPVVNGMLIGDMNGNSNSIVGVSNVAAATLTLNSTISNWSQVGGGAAPTNLVGTNGISVYGAGASFVISPTQPVAPTNQFQVGNNLNFITGLQQQGLWQNLVDAWWLATNQSVLPYFVGLKGATLGWATVGTGSNLWNGASVTGSGLQSTNLPSISGPVTMLIFSCPRGWANPTNAVLAGLYADANPADGGFQLVFKPGSGGNYLSGAIWNSGTSYYTYTQTSSMITNGDVTPGMTAFQTDWGTTFNAFNDNGGYSHSLIAQSPLTLGSFVIGASPNGAGIYTSNYNGLIYGAAIFNAFLTSNQIFNVYTLAKQTVLPWQNTTWEGDSILIQTFHGAQFGYGGLSLVMPQANAETNNPLWSVGKISMCGYGGKGVFNMTNHFPFVDLTNAPNGTTIRNNVPFLYQGGRNNISAYSPIGLYLAASNMVLWAHQSGFYPVGVATLIAASNELAAIGNYTNTSSYNGYVRSNTCGADYIADQDFMLSNAVNSVDPTVTSNYWTNNVTLGYQFYSPDGIHPTNIGNVLYGSNLVYSVRNFLPQTNAASPFSFTSAPFFTNFIQALLNGAYGGTTSPDLVLDSVTATNTTRAFISTGAAAGFTAETASSGNANYQFLDLTTGNFYDMVISGPNGDDFQLLQDYNSGGLVAVENYSPASGVWQWTGKGEIVSPSQTADTVLFLINNTNFYGLSMGTVPGESGGSADNSFYLYGSTNGGVGTFRVATFTPATPLTTWNGSFAVVGQTGIPTFLQFQTQPNGAYWIIQKDTDTGQSGGLGTSALNFIGSKGASGQTNVLQLLPNVVNVGTNVTIASGSSIKFNSIPSGTATQGLGLTSGGTIVPTTLASGTVTSVSGAGDGTVFASGSYGTVTSSGTLTLPTPQNETANKALMGPTSGSAAAPTFRNITGADLAPNTAGLLTNNGSGGLSWVASPTGGTTLSNLAIVVSNSLLAMGTTYSNATGYPIIVQGGVQFNTGSGVDAVCYFVHTNLDGLGWQTNYLRAEGALASDSFLYPFAFTLGTNATWFFTDASTGGASTVLTNMRVTQITGGGGITTVSNNVTLGQTYLVNMTNYLVPSNTWILFFGSSFNDPSGGYTGGKPFNFLTNMPLVAQMNWITNAALSGKGITNALFAWTNTAGGTVSSVSNLVWQLVGPNIGKGGTNVIAFLEGSVNNLSGAEQDPQTGANFLLPDYSNDVKMLVTNMQSIGILVDGTTIVPRADGQQLSDNYISNYMQFNEFLSQYAGFNFCADWGRIAGGNCQDWNFFASNNPPHMTAEGYKALATLWEESLFRPVPTVSFAVTPAFQGIPWIKDYTSGWQQYGTNGVLVVKDDYGNLHFPMFVNGTNYAEPNFAYVPYGTTISGQLSVTAGNGQTATTVSIVPFGPNSGSGPTDKQVLTYSSANKAYYPSNVSSGAGLPTFSSQFNSDGTQTNLNTNQTFLSVVVASNLMASNIAGVYGIQGTNRNSQGYQVTTGTTSGSLTVTPNAANTNAFSVEAPASYIGPWLMQWKSNSTPVSRMDAWGSLNLSGTNYASYFYWSNAPLIAGTGISLSTAAGKTTITATGGGGGGGFTGNPNQQASDGTYTNIIIGALLTNTVTRGPTLIFPQTNSNPSGMYRFSGSNEYWFRTNFVNFAVTGTSNMLMLCTNFFPTNAGMMSIRATLAISDNTQRDIASGPCLCTAFLATPGGTPTVQATFVNTTTIYLPGANMVPGISATNSGFWMYVASFGHTSDILNGYADFDVTMVGTNTYFPASGQNP